MILVAGTPKMTIEDLKTMRPPRPPELDMLNVFIGRWEWEGEGKIAALDEPVRFSGSRESQWEGDGWYLVTREVGNMEGLDESRTLTIWSYDTRAKRFRTAYVDSTGTTMIGTARYNATTNTWYCCATSHGPAGTRSARGHVWFPDPDTMQWDWTEFSMAGLRKSMELTGVCRRTP